MKKSSFIAFLFSMFPGCGLMYLGYMKKGTQIMFMIAASIFLAIATGSMGLGWIFVLMLPAIWFYQLFDTLHSHRRMVRQGIEVPEDDGFFFPQRFFVLKPVANRSVAKVLAFVLIGLGIYMVSQSLLSQMHHFLPWRMVDAIRSTISGLIVPTIVSIILIVIGVKLLKGSKTDSGKEQNLDMQTKEDE